MLNAVLVLLVSGAFSKTNANDEDVTKQKLQHIGQHKDLIIDTQIQAASGLKTRVVESVRHHAEFEAIGKVISIQALLALRERYLLAKAELNAANAKLKQVGQSLKRQQQLYRHGIAAKRTLQEQEALGSEDKAIVDTSHVRLMAISNEAKLLWGKELAEWALADKTSKLKPFLSGKQQLIQVTLPTNKQLASEIDTIAIEPNGQRHKARQAVLISRSVQADNVMQGESYFFQASADGLAIGMKVLAWIPETTFGQSGVMVPESAFVWYMDRVYAYIKLSKDTFTRRLILKFLLTAEGYFVEEGIKVGEEVVTTGGQMLLSEELRGQIPDED